MYKNLIPLSAAAFLVMTSVQAADSAVSIPLSRHRAPHPTFPPAGSVHRADVALESSAAAAITLNSHVALWHSFDVPAAANGTQPTNINDLGEITGAYFDSNGNQHGFLRGVSGNIVIFDAPNVGYPAQPTLGIAGTIPSGINNQGDIIGYYTDANSAYHGFIRSANGKFTVIDDPSSTSAPPATWPNAINDSGMIVGMWFDSNFNIHGFVRQVDGSFTTVDAPNDLATGLYHVNNLGEAAGETDDVNNVSHGVLLHSDGKVTTFEAPNAANTYGGFTQALNLNGSFAGEYEDINNGVHGYVRYANDNFSEFTVPGAGKHRGNGTYSSSLNLLGTVIGFSFEPHGSPADGYVRFPDGTLALANAPVAGQQSTFPYAINDVNEFTGYWYDANGAEHGFVALAVP